uniref:GH18 domain-containing protein n=1 Tax=Glossina palpalis gambiensis TaxID=67801 RepID=A0A1B0B686_9MUSC
MLYFKLHLFVIIFANLQIFQVQAANIFCYYDTQRITDVNAAINYLEPALQFCNFLIYGYAGIDSETYQVKSLDYGLNYDIYQAITSLKLKHNHLKVLLSIGGDRDKIDDLAEDNKYLKLLENLSSRNAFINSIQSVIRTYGFDGLDMAWQFPKNPPKHEYTGFRKYLDTLMNWFRKRPVIDENSVLHKEQFVSLLKELRQSLNPMGAIMTMTVLPHVSAEIFLDVTSIVNHVDFIILAAFDYLTPYRDPTIAHYTAPIYAVSERDPSHNINYDVQYWRNHTTATSKLVLGIPAYGRSWTMIKKSGITGHPPIIAGGPARAGHRTLTPGLLSWPEICVKIHQNKELEGDAARFRKVSDPTKRFGTYAYRSVDENNEHGIWVSYEEPKTAANKADYARARNLSGVALFDLSMDDVTGECGEGNYSILKSIHNIFKKSN